ncbi:Oidioi.mRNA.OKI2018_I69.chr1.g137.t2.cds [Oikopleura dioica]|uniref:Oidioi.mRNA.OKI2018_I69.chr1.g137.t2.cds n=1 Tax=Oikopleura dioica TaxID=34765 RepID=A0ABN7SIW6_OIKDI|nr:Oidioi.mRNA.OKI2018_I69.chr1.g137.t2.cds [Oikopleura dioica]
MKIIAVLLGIVFSRDFTEADIVHIYKRETEFCFTEHVFSGETDSIRVRKSCMTRNKCHQEQLGCHTDPITGLTTCKECCEGEICNLAVPKSNERFEEMLIEIGFNSARNFFSTIVVFITALFLL